MKMEYTVAQELASLCQACHNCHKVGNGEWLKRHGETMGWVVRQFLSSGSGIDSGVTIDVSRSNDKKLTLHCDYHHMNEGGMYDGWTEHTITVTPAFRGVDIRVGGRDRNGIKEYLYEVFDSALSEICHCIWYEGKEQHNEMGWYHRTRNDKGEEDSVWHKLEV